MLGRKHQLDRQLNRQHHQRALPVAFHEEQISGLEPAVELKVRAGFHFGTAGAAEQRNVNIAGPLAAGGAGQRHAEAREPERDQFVDQLTLYADPFPLRATAPTHDTALIR